MRKIIKNLLAVYISCVLIFGFGFSKTIRLIIMSGQSNMEGQPAKSDDPVIEAQINTFYSPFPANLTFSENKSWKYFHIPAEFGYVGPEVSFCHAICTTTPSDDYLVVKVARGGTAVVQWIKDTTQTDGLGKTSYYSLLIATINSNVQDAISGGDTVVVDSMMWMQGEAEQGNYPDPNGYLDYEANLNQLIADVRGDLGAPNMHFFIGLADSHVDSYGTTPERTLAVKIAQSNVANNDANAYIVSTYGLTRMDQYDTNFPNDTNNCCDLEDIHYDLAGQMKLGSNFATTYLAQQVATTSLPVYVSGSSSSTSSSSSVSSSSSISSSSSVASSSTSSTVSSSTSEENKNFGTYKGAYPNPAKISDGLVKFKALGIYTDGDVEIKIYDLSGHLVWHGNKNWNMQNITHRHVTPGIYLYNIEYQGYSLDKGKILITE